MYFHRRTKKIDRFFPSWLLSFLPSCSYPYPKAAKKD